jgi:hypothetical protein
MPAFNEITFLNLLYYKQMHLYFFPQTSPLGHFELPNLVVLWNSLLECHVGGTGNSPPCDLLSFTRVQLKVYAWFIKKIK